MDESILLGLLRIAGNKIILRMLFQDSAGVFCLEFNVTLSILFGMVKQQVQERDMPKMFNKFLVH